MTGRPLFDETSTHGSVLEREVEVFEETSDLATEEASDSATVESDCSSIADLSELEHPQNKRDTKAAIRIWKRGIACRLRMWAP